MKAWRVYGPDDMRLDEVPLPDVKPGWLLVKIKKVQVSITEVASFKKLSSSGDKSTQRPFPRQMYGHEFCAEIVEIGDTTSPAKVGDRGFYYGCPACHTCAMCQAGYEDLCCKGPMLGMDIPGGLAEYTLLPVSGTISVPASITDSEAAAMQPLVGTLGAVRLIGVELGDTVVVLGQGSMGLNAMQICRSCGAARVIGVDINENNLAISASLGADVVINAGKEDPVEAVMKATKGVGADVVFECAGGSPEMGVAGMTTINQALRMVRDQGKISQIALLGSDVSINIGPINSKGVLYRGLGTSTHKLAQYAIDLVSTKRVQLAPLINHVLEGIENIPEAFEITGNKAKYKTINPAQVNVA
jgi:threonine dehydrogenase-like Zn-dependent dehydrogenase